MTRRTIGWSLALSLVAGPAAGQRLADERSTPPPWQLDDERWVPWLGCWALWQEQFEDPSQLQETEDQAGIVGRTAVCVTPAEEGILLRATAGERLLVERALVADGVRREINEDGCQGWEQNSWSNDGQRLFTQGELTCGDGATRRVNGVSLIASTSSWVDAQLVRYGEREQLEVRRYSPMTSAESDERLGEGRLPYDAAEIRRARRASSANLVLSDVMEANRTSHPRVLEAMLVETEPALDLDASSLITLDDAGIDHGVIDLLVALAYPDHFVVDRRNRGGSWSSGLASSYGGLGGYNTGSFDPMWYDQLYPYYVTPFGSSQWGRGYNPYLYGAAASPFVVIPNGDGSVGRSYQGRAYEGRGYTRVRPRDPAPSQVRGRSGGGGGGVSTGSSSGGGSVSRGGYSGGGGGTTTSSSGGGGSSTGRRAVPRSR